MKAWQLGYELDTLIEWTNKFEDYNKFCYSPFSKAKKNGMATSLSKGNLYEQNEMVYEMRTAKTTSKVKMFGAGPEIAEVHKGEKIITKLSNGKSDILKRIGSEFRGFLSLIVLMVLPNLFLYLNAVLLTAS